MASARYDLLPPPEPEEELPPMTKKQKREHFIYYYKWHCIGIAIAVSLITGFIYEQVTRVDPDYTIGVTSTMLVSDDAFEKLADALEPLFDDRNGDGQVVVYVSTYPLAVGEAAQTANPETQMAASTRLIADVGANGIAFFLTDNPVGYQEMYGIFAYNDGTIPAEGAALDTAQLGVKWGDCPMLASLDLGAAVDPMMDEEETDLPRAQSLLEDFYVIRRANYTEGFDAEELAAYEIAYAAFDAITAKG